MKNENLTKLELELSKLLKKAIDALFDAGEDQISNSLQSEMEKVMQEKIDHMKNTNNQIIVEYKKNFKSEARTLPPESVTDCRESCGVFTKTHPSGWTITGEVHEDYYYWVNEFTAHHPEYGSVRGDFENKVYVDSHDALNHFVKNHPPEDWDYHDI
jgi:hypothetical protein